MWKVRSSTLVSVDPFINTHTQRYWSPFNILAHNSYCYIRQPTICTCDKHLEGNYIPPMPGLLTEISKCKQILWVTGRRGLSMMKKVNDLHAVHTKILQKTMSTKTPSTNIYQINDITTFHGRNSWRWGHYNSVHKKKYKEQEKRNNVLPTQ